jgi:hypothetical protein
MRPGWEEWGAYIQGHSSSDLEEDLRGTPEAYRQLVALAMTVGRWETIDTHSSSPCGLCLLAEQLSVPGERCIHCVARRTMTTMSLSLCGKPSSLYGRWVDSRCGTGRKAHLGKEVRAWVHKLYAEEYRKVFGDGA